MSNTQNLRKVIFSVLVTDTPVSWDRSTAQHITIKFHLFLTSHLSFPTLGDWLKDPWPRDFIHSFVLDLSNAS